MKPIVLAVLDTSYFKWFISSANNMDVIVCFSKRTMPILVDLFHTARKIPDSIDKPLLNYTIFCGGRYSDAVCSYFFPNPVYVGFYVGLNHCNVRIFVAQFGELLAIFWPNC